MPLGVLKVGAALLERGFEVECLDLSGVTNFAQAARSYASKSTADAYAITSTTPQLPACFEIVKAIRSGCQKPVILGGPHATLTYASAKRETSGGRGTRLFNQLTEQFDCVVCGDGETGVFEALKFTSKVVDADSVASPMFMSSADFDLSPFPARHLIDARSYTFKFEGSWGLSLIAQLGCPFVCRFCSGRQSPTFRKIRLRSTARVISEIEQMWNEYRCESVMFYDDELNVNPKMTELMIELARLKDRLGVDFKFRGCVKAELFTEDQARLMARAGFRMVLVGPESGDNRILKNISKKATVLDNTRCVEIAKKHGIKTKALMSIGHPGESHKSVENTHRWLNDVRPDDFDVSILTVMPGTPYYDGSTHLRDDIWEYTTPDTGDKLYSVEVDYTTTYSYYKGNPDDGYKSFVFTDHLTREELVAARDWLERDLRQKLNVPFPPKGGHVEHSMGMSG